MKPISVLQVGNNTTTTQNVSASQNQTQGQTQNQTTTQSSPSKGQAISAFFKKAFSKKLEDWNVFLLFAIALGAAILGRYVATRMLEGSQIGFVWQELIKDALAFLLLGAFASLSDSTKIGTAVFLLVVAFSISVLARHDYTYKVDRSEKQYMVLKPGCYQYDLKAGQEMPWRGFPGGKSGYSVSSDTNDFTLFFSDGTSYPCNKPITIPKKEKVFFKAKANSPQKILVTIF